MVRKTNTNGVGWAHTEKELEMIRMMQFRRSRTGGADTVISP